MSVSRTATTCVPRLRNERGAFELFTEGDVLFEAMLQSIASARHDVRLASYIFADDEIGRRFAAALTERARAGVRVRLHLDAVGCTFWFSPKTPQASGDELACGGRRWRLLRHRQRPRFGEVAKQRRRVPLFIDRSDAPPRGAGT